MSASFALVKFKSTGNIYFGCYEGTSDILIPYICTPEECYDEKLDCYCSISHCRDLSAQHKTWAYPDNVPADEVEIYSDYGGGFYWNGHGSESIKMIKDFLDPWDNYTTIEDGKPEWVEEFLKSLEGDDDSN